MPWASKFSSFVRKNGPCSALSSSHTSGHKTIYVPSGENLGWAVLSSSPAHSHFTFTPPSSIHTHTHTYILTKKFRFLPGLVCAPWLLCISFFFSLEKALWAFWQRSHHRACKCGQAQTQALWNWSAFFCSVSTKRDLPVTNVLQLTVWLPWKGFGVGGV